MTTKKPETPACEAAGRFDKLLNENGFRSNTKLAKLLGVSDATISRYRSGERAPSPDRLAEICRKVPLSADEVLGLNLEGAWPSHEAARWRRAVSLADST